jgi:enamine deaminase RidA (YjgF/YER057c/UK114 family)
VTELARQVPTIPAIDLIPATPLPTGTRTLTGTLEALLGTAVGDMTATVTTTTVLDDGDVGDLRVTIHAVRVVALDRTLTDPEDDWVVVVRAAFVNASDRPLVFQAATQTSVRDAAGQEYGTDTIARASARTREPDPAIPARGGRQGEIAYRIPRNAAGLRWVVRFGTREASFPLPDSLFATPEVDTPGATPQATQSALPSVIGES